MRSHRYTEEQFRSAVDDPDVRNIADLCRALGIVPRGASYETVRQFARTIEVDLGRLEPERPRRPEYTDDELAAAVAANHSMAAVIRQLGGRLSRSSYRRVRADVERLDLSTTHWKGQGWSRGMTFPERRRPIEEYLVEGRLIAGTDLRLRLIAAGLKEHRCEMCRRTRWNDRPIPLELDHINGDRRDNRLANLRLLCPNCHALTPTYRGRNIGRYGDVHDEVVAPTDVDSSAPPE